MIIFNLLFIIAEIIFYSGVLFPVSFTAAVLMGSFSMIVFFGANHYFLSAAERLRKPEYLKSVRDCQKALQYRIKKEKRFREELHTAKAQLMRFSQRQNVLYELAEPGSPFRQISDDVRNDMIMNIRKIISRVMIHAPKTEIHRILQQNQELLKQYDVFLLEISGIGEEASHTNLEAITSALQELKEEP